MLARAGRWFICEGGAGDGCSELGMICGGSGGAGGRCGLNALLIPQIDLQIVHIDP